MLSYAPRLTRNATAVIVQTLVVVAALFVLYRYLLSSIGAELLGLWSLVLAATTVTRITDLGFGGSVIKFVARYRALGDDVSAGLVVSTATITIGAAMGVLLPAAYLLIIKVLPLFVPDQLVPAAVQVLPFALFSLWLSCISGVYQSTLDASHRFDLRAFSVCASQVTLVVAAVAFVGRFGFPGLAYAQVLQAIVAFALTFVFARKVLALPTPGAHAWNRALFRELLGYATTVQANGLVQMFFEPATRFVLSKYGGLTSVAYFEMASRMVLQLRALLVSASQVLVPVIAEMQETATEDLPPTYVRWVEGMTILAGISFTSLAAAVPAISQLWIGHINGLFVTFSLVLIAGWWLNTVTVPAYQIYLGIGRLRWNFVSHLVTGVLNVALGLSLGAWYGPTGVALGMVAALAIGSLIPTLAFVKEYETSFRAAVSGATRTIYASCAAALILAAAWLIHEPPDRGLFAQTAMFLVMFGALAALLCWRHPLRGELVLLMRAAR